MFDIVRDLKPSGRGELEITDVNNAYVDRGVMEYDVIDGFWGDAGESIDVYYEVIDYVRAARRRTAASVRRAARGGLSAMRILVTGGAGFIGSEFVRRRSARYPDDEVVVLDKLTYAGNLDNLQPSPSDPRYSLRRRATSPIATRSSARSTAAEAMVNFAAETHVDRSILDAGRVRQTDVYGTWTLPRRRAPRASSASSR